MNNRRSLYVPLAHEGLEWLNNLLSEKLKLLSENTLGRTLLYSIFEVFISKSLILYRIILISRYKY